MPKVSWHYNFRLKVHTAFATQKYEAKPAACLPTEPGVPGRQNQPEKSCPLNVPAPKRLPLPENIHVKRHSPQSGVSKRPWSLYGIIGTASALGLSLLINFLLAVNIEKSHRETAERLQSIHRLIQMLSSNISRLSNEVDEVEKLYLELRNNLQKSTDVGNKKRQNMEPTQSAKSSGGTEARATNRKMWLPRVLQEPPRRPIPLKSAEFFMRGS
jgi:hypothetical protein